MRQSMTTLLFSVTVLVAQVYAAPQLISFKDGKVGVNFAGYHASAGLGGLLGQGGAGGLFAEAGTPHGQNARAGLGGAVDSNGQSSGGLYAGATAGGNVRAQAGLAGGVTGEHSAGTGYASAQAGDRFASAGMGGEASGSGSSGFTFSGRKSIGISGGKVKEVSVHPIEIPAAPPAAPPVNLVPIQPVLHKNVEKEVKVEAENEVSPSVPELPPVTVVKEVSKLKGPHRYYKKYYRSHFRDYNIMNFLSSLFSPPAYQYHQELSWQSPRYEVYRVMPKVYVPLPPPPPRVIEKTYVRTHYKPHRHHLRKYFGGYIGAEAGPAPPAAAVEVQPVLQKRIDVGAESAVGAEAHALPASEIGYTKQVTVQRNPNFYRDIFNIPISVLQSVGNLVGNIAGGTSVSVQKSASVHTDADAESSKHHIAPLSSSSSETQVSVQTPSASNFFADIFAIPINTLEAVNKFLENNVAGKKTVQITGDPHNPSAPAPVRVRRGPHARRLNKQVVVLDTVEAEPPSPESHIEQ